MIDRPARLPIDQGLGRDGRGQLGMVPAHDLPRLQKTRNRRIRCSPYAGSQDPRRFIDDASSQKPPDLDRAQSQSGPGSFQRAGGADPLALTLREASLAPVLYIPRADADMMLLERTSHRTHCPFKSDANYYSLKVSNTRRSCCCAFANSVLLTPRY